MKRLYEISRDHLFYAIRHPGHIDEMAVKIKVTREMAIALAIADQVCEEFAMRLRN